MDRPEASSRSKSDSKKTAIISRQKLAHEERKNTECESSSHRRKSKRDQALLLKVEEDQEIETSRLIFSWINPFN